MNQSQFAMSVMVAEDTNTILATQIQVHNRNIKRNTNTKTEAKPVCNVSHGSWATQIDCTLDKFNLSPQWN